ncbi:somatostatin receptor type 5-like [Rhinophrynus dorsalis]
MENFTIDSIFLDLDLDLDMDYDNDSYNYTTVDYSSPKDISKSYIFYLLVFVFGLVGNALVIFVVLRHKRMWTISNIYVFSLALGDLFYMLCLLFFALEIAYSYWPLGAPMCKVFWVLSTLVAFTSTYFLSAMSVSDYVQVYFPDFSSKRLGPKAAVGISVCVWLLSILLGIPIFLHADIDFTFSCKIIWPETTAITFTAYQFAMAFAVPLLITCVCTIFTAARVRCPEKPSAIPGGVGKENVILILVLGLVFVIIWLPIYVLEFMSVTHVITELSEDVYYFVSLVPYLKCCIYPIMYGLLSQSFKEAFKNIFCCRKVKDATSPQENFGEKQEETKASNC